MQTPLQRALNRQRASRNALRSTARLLLIAQSKHCDPALKASLSRLGAVHGTPALRYIGRAYAAADGVTVPVCGRVT